MLAACAKQGYPSGGPKDETPPVVIATEPPNGTSNFDAKEFYIQFDEYVTVKDADNNILVSPPMKQKPEYKTKGRGIVAKLKDTLRANTTYLFQFKEAIVDFNEGNTLSSYEYVFSTGSTIDSMTLRGRVLDAFSRKPRTETVTVMAYAESQLNEMESGKMNVDTLNDSIQINPSTENTFTSNSDSIVAKIQPMYITRCDKEGNFALNHLRKGRYILLALEDGDKNLRLNSDEPVAFLDTLVLAVKMPPPPDTSAKNSSVMDSTAAVTDSSAATQEKGNAKMLERVSDTSISTHSDIDSYYLFMSQDKREPQRVTKSNFATKQRIEIITQIPLSRHYSLRQLTADSTTPELQIYHRLRTKGDTLDVWLGAKGCDSIVLTLCDTTGLNDTLRLKHNVTAKTPRGIKAPPAAKTRIVKSLIAASHPYFDTLWLQFSNPIEGVCKAWDDTAALDTAVQVMIMSDSSRTHCGIRMLSDSSFAPAIGIKAYIDFIGKPGEKYQFTLPEDLFYDIYLYRSDSITITTEFTKTESYGNIYLTLESNGDTTYPSPLIVQLTNEKGDVLCEQVAAQPCKLPFPHLKGGKYGFRAIVDSDHNGRWTPGNYWQHRQPEEVLFFEKTLELRENWDMEEKWQVGTNDKN